jgi:signal recognition particle receptor subunit beta
MDSSQNTSDGARATASKMPFFASSGLGMLQNLRTDFDELKETLADIECIGGPDVARKIQRMAQELDAFEPSVTFIGQIKSGKTTLVNAMAGYPGLLPADVNPWTSVVTSLHLNQPRGDAAPKASFTFFNAGEWDHLVSNGGRIGEISARAGADKEFEKLTAQIAEMHQKTRERLGRKFELLLGQTHNYQHIDDKLIQRYVCLGDDFDTMSVEEKQGLFADITKSADLFLDAPQYPLGLCLRDTPGMNDTFMMREQITIQSIRDSKICVVVLSAHQALNAVDMGLIRLISNVKSRQVVMFVNRIDELSDPATQIPEIRDSLYKTLADNNGPEDPCIIFGSAFWASAVLDGTVSEMPEASIDALENYGSSDLTSGIDGLDEDHAVWIMSGLPALNKALAERIVETAGRRASSGIRRRAANMVAGLRASSSIVTLKANSAQIQRLSNEEVEKLIIQLEQETLVSLSRSLDDVFEGFAKRVDQAHARFIARAVDSLVHHLETVGEGEVWSYSPDGLRMLVRTAYQVMRTKFQSTMTTELKTAAARLTAAYSEIFDVTNENFEVEAPEAPEIPPPVQLAQTIALDIKTPWWKGWWRRRKGYGAFANDFRELVEAESTPMVNSLKITQAQEIRENAEQLMHNFLVEQRAVLADICEKSQVSLEDLHGIFGVNSQREREELFAMIYDELGMDEAELGDAA